MTHDAENNLPEWIEIQPKEKPIQMGMLTFYMLEKHVRKNTSFEFFNYILSSINNLMDNETQLDREKIGSYQDGRTNLYYDDKSKTITSETRLKRNVIFGDDKVVLGKNVIPRSSEETLISQFECYRKNRLNAERSNIYNEHMNLQEIIDLDIKAYNPKVEYIFRTTKGKALSSKKMHFNDGDLFIQTAMERMPIHEALTRLHAFRTNIQQRNPTS